MKIIFMNRKNNNSKWLTFYAVIKLGGLSPDYLKAFFYGISANIGCLCIVLLMLWLIPKPKNQLVALPEAI